MTNSHTITVWEAAGPVADEERFRRLRRMTDQEAREAFARVLALWRPPDEPTATSGLAELERLLAAHERGRR